MTNLEEMTKKQLLDLAKEHEITGRHDMTKDELVEALADYVDEEEEDGEDEDLDAVEIADAATLVELKKRKPSRNARDGHGRVIRQGTNLSGNTPFNRKYYGLGVKRLNDEAVRAAPGQVQLILKYMMDHQITVEDPQQGHEIVAGAKAHGYLKSKIPDANLFAYYARLLQALGVVHVEDME